MPRTWGITAIGGQASAFAQLARILHEFEAFIYKALKGTAVVDYCKLLITQ